MVRVGIGVRISIGMSTCNRTASTIGICVAITISSYIFTSSHNSGTITTCTTSYLNDN